MMKRHFMESVLHSCIPICFLEPGTAGLICSQRSVTQLKEKSNFKISLPPSFPFSYFLFWCIHVSTGAYWNTLLGISSNLRNSESPSSSSLLVCLRHTVNRKTVAAKCHWTKLHWRICPTGVCLSRTLLCHQFLRHCHSASSYSSKCYGIQRVISLKDSAHPPCHWDLAVSEH